MEDLKKKETSVDDAAKVQSAEQAKGTPETDAKPIDPDYPLTHVPKSARRSFFSVAAVLLGITFFSPTMNTGAQIAAAFTFKDLIWISLVGNLILGVYVAANCAIGAKTGLTSAMLSRYTLGTIGSKWVSFLLGGTQIGWYAYVSSYVGQMFAVAFNVPQHAIWFTLFWALVFGVTALWGYEAIEKVAIVAVPALLILVIYIPIVASQSAGGFSALFNVMPTEEMSVATALTAIMGTFASMGTQPATGQILKICSRRLLVWIRCIHDRQYDHARSRCCRRIGLQRVGLCRHHDEHGRCCNGVGFDHFDAEHLDDGARGRLRLGCCRRRNVQ